MMRLNILLSLRKQEETKSISFSVQIDLILAVIESLFLNIAIQLNNQKMQFN